MNKFIRAKRDQKIKDLKEHLSKLNNTTLNSRNSYIIKHNIILTKQIIEILQDNNKYL